MVRDLLAFVLQELRARRSIRRRAERRNSVAYSIRFTDAFKLCQYGLTSCQPHSGVKVASRSVVWTVALDFYWLPFCEAHGQSGFDVCKGRWLLVVGHNMRAPHWKKRPRLANRRNGEEAKERASHIRRAILGHSTCFTCSLLQNVLRHLRHRHTRRNDAKQLFVSNWSKF